MSVRPDNLCEVSKDVPLSELRESHILHKRPFVCRGYFAADEDRWNDETLVELIGDAKVPVFYTDAEQSWYTDGRLFVQIIPFREMVERENSGIQSAGYVLAKDIAEQLPRFYEKLDVPDIVRSQQCNFWYGRRHNVTRLHYDRADNIVSVLRGTKVFTIVPPYAKVRTSPFWGKGAVNFTSAGADPPDFRRQGGYQVEIGPGDLFYLPRSWWHHVVSSPGVAVNFWWDEMAPTMWSELRLQRRHFFKRAARRVFDRVLKRSLSMHIKSGPRPGVGHATLRADDRSFDVEIMKLGIGVMYVRRGSQALPPGTLSVEIALPRGSRPVTCKGIVRPTKLDDDLAEILFDEISSDDTDRLVELVAATQRACGPGEI